MVPRYTPKGFGEFLSSGVADRVWFPSPTSWYWKPPRVGRPTPGPPDRLGLGMCSLFLGVPNLSGPTASFSQGSEAGIGCLSRAACSPTPPDSLLQLYGFLLAPLEREDSDYGLLFPLPRRTMQIRSYSFIELSLFFLWVESVRHCAQAGAFPDEGCRRVFTAYEVILLPLSPCSVLPS